MSQNLMQMCLDHEELNKYVYHYAGKLKRLFPRLLEFEDAESELWLAIFKAISSRYNPDIALFLFAKRAVFSKYGSMIRWRSNAGRYMNEWVHSEDTVHFSRNYDSGYNEVDATFTLDQIEKDLKERTEVSQQYHLAVTIFQLLRKGNTVRQCCRVLKISDRQGYKIYNEIIWGYETYRDKYWEGTITRDWRDYDENIKASYRCDHREIKGRAV